MWVSDAAHDQIIESTVQVCAYVDMDVDVDVDASERRGQGGGRESCPGSVCAGGGARDTGGRCCAVGERRGSATARVAHASCRCATGTTRSCPGHPRLAIVVGLSWVALIDDLSTSVPRPRRLVDKLPVPPGRHGRSLTIVV